jgi:Na+/H+ antiporter NhaD/arsenite permease-like protein
MYIILLFLSLCAVFVPTSPALASTLFVPPQSEVLNFFIIFFFSAGYSLVLLEERIHLRKSKPVSIAAGLIWACVVLAYMGESREQIAINLLRQTLLEYAELLLFLLSAMTYVNAMEDRGVFNLLRAKLVSKGFSLRSLFWLCGAIAFLMSPIADNLTTALILAAVAIAVGEGNKRFIMASCINVVVAANAGGVFSPFGDITTLMVWQKDVVQFHEFLTLFFPALISWFIPALILSFIIPKGRSEASKERVQVKRGGFVICGLFLMTIFITVLSHQMMHIPPFLGMMTGLGILKTYGNILRRYDLRNKPVATVLDQEQPFDIFVSLRRVEWDTLIFFYGVMLCVSGLAAMGHLHILSNYLYNDLGHTDANVLIGLLSAVLGNIPVMFAVLSMDLTLSLGQWLLVTLTVGIGGSLLSIGSAAGVALMGQARGIYTFMDHLKWSWAILLGYLAAVGTHMIVNAAHF